jgi:hypothetical protein
MTSMPINFSSAGALLKQAMREQIANPTRAVVNGESAFVRERLEREGEFYLARQYWNWVCMGRVYDQDLMALFDAEIVELQSQLNAIDQAIQLPDWAHKGT